jgi:hypothetical protein
MGTVVSDRRGDSESQAQWPGIRRPAAVHAVGAELAGSPDKYWLVVAVAVFLGLLAWTLLARSPLQVMDAEGAFSAANVAATAPATDTYTVRAESK